MKDFLRSIFRQQPFENMLVFLLGKFPNKLFRLLVSSNNLYPPNSMRKCRRYGINYYLDINDYQNWLLYFYNNIDSSFGVLNYIGKANIILDIGGNIGQTALMMAKNTEDKTLVYSFEPYPATYKKCLKNIELNAGIASKIKLQQVALGSSAGSLNMYEDCVTNSGANRIIPAGAAVNTLTTTVPVSTVDIFIKDKRLPKIDFIKIDVEGFEMEVLKGSHETLANDKPSLFIEIDDANLKKQGSGAVELCKYLEQFGYEIFEEGKKERLHYDGISKAINIYCPR